jgi:hypothetical protein
VLAVSAATLEVGLTLAQAASAAGAPAETQAVGPAAAAGAPAGTPVVIPAAAAIQATTRALVALAKPRTAALKDLGAMMRAARAARTVAAMLAREEDAVEASRAMKGKHR